MRIIISDEDGTIFKISAVKSDGSEVAVTFCKTIGEALDTVKSFVTALFTVN